MRLITKPCNSLPVEIKHHQLSNRLEISFDDGSVYILPAEYLRVFTQSAEAVGHGPGQETLQYSKEDISIKDIRPIGNYGILLVFSDGHDSGIYTWDLLYQLGSDYPLLWAAYLEQLEMAGITRKPTRSNSH